MIASRRLMFASAAACMYGTHVLFPKKSFADADVESFTRQNTLHERVNKMNTQDNVKVRELRIQDVLTWEAVKDNRMPIAQYVSTLDDDILFELYWMTSFYNKPLKIDQKVRARTLLLRLYDKSKNEDERQMFEAIMNYFDLL